MGVLNVTPDSFSDGGRYLDAGAAVARGLELSDEGARWVDVGGESTRPGARPVEVAEELRRVLPVVEALAAEGVAVSIDTRNAEVARAAVAAGATLVNDVSSSLGDVAADLGVAWIAMHAQGPPETMQDDPRYDDVVAEVRDHLVARAEVALAAGVPEVWIDPGLGFGKTLAHNLTLLAHLDSLVATGLPIVVGASRKGFIGHLTARSDRCEPPVPIGERLDGSLAVATWAMAQGARMIRAHDVRPTVEAAMVVAGEIAA
jgi:dihydropteroate synthase